MRGARGSWVFARGAKKRQAREYSFIWILPLGFWFAKIEGAGKKGNLRTERARYRLWRYAATAAAAPPCSGDSFPRQTKKPCAGHGEAGYSPEGRRFLCRAAHKRACVVFRHKCEPAHLPQEKLKNKTELASAWANMPPPPNKKALLLQCFFVWWGKLDSDQRSQ